MIFTDQYVEFYVSSSNLIPEDWCHLGLQQKDGKAGVEIGKPVC